MLTDKAFKNALFVSFTAHILFVGGVVSLKSTMFEKVADRTQDEITVYVENIKPVLLPPIDAVGEKKSVQKDDSKLKDDLVEAKKQIKDTPDISNYENVLTTRSNTVQPDEIPLPESVVENVHKIDSKHIDNELDQKSTLKYFDIVKRRIEAHRMYPPYARDKNIQGDVCLGFRIYSNGNVENVRVVKSSSHKILDDEAQKTVFRAVPFPKFPKYVNSDFVDIEVVIVFDLK